MEGSSHTHLVSRRSALRAAAIGAGTAWVAPVIQVVSMQRADAASAPPDRVRPSNRGVRNKGRGQNSGQGNGA